MSWRDRLQPASFRGVDAFVESDNVSGGRRIVLHEYPLRDDPHAQDMGKKAKGFSIEFYLLGPDYDLARDRFVEALDAAGAGALVIPKYRGQQQVVVDDYQVRHLTSEGGMVRISVRFLPAGRLLFPSATTSTVSNVASKATTLKTSAATDFLNRFSLTGRPEWLADNAIGIARQATSYLRTLNGRIDSLTSPISEFAREITALDDELTTLIRTPQQFAARMQSVIGALRNVVRSPADRVTAFDQLVRFGNPPAAGQATGTEVPPVEVTTTNRQQEADNQQALIGLIRATAFAEAGVALSESTFTTRDQAQTARDNMIDHAAVLRDAPLDGQTPAVELEYSRDTLAAIGDTLHAVTADLEQRSIQLPRLSTHTTGAQLPAVVIAYTLYGDPNRAGEIVERNRIRHPGFIALGQTLEILSDVA